MKNLIKKEMTLTASSLTYIFILFSVTTLIPGYPILVGAFFVCLGIFYSFQFSREYNDILFSALLPVKKSDIVKAKYLFTVFIQFISFFIFALLTVLRITLLENSAAYTANPLMRANIAFLGWILIIFALFNIIFLEKFFKTAYYIGKPFVLFCICAFAVVAAAESIWHFPNLETLATTDSNDFGIQAILLFAGIFVYVSGTILSCRKSIKNFEKIDLQ